MAHQLMIGYCEYYATGEGCHIFVEAACDLTYEELHARFTREQGEWIAQGFEYVEYSDAPQKVKDLMPKAFLEVLERLPDNNCGGLKLSLKFDWNLS